MTASGGPPPPGYPPSGAPPPPPMAYPPGPPPVEKTAKPVVGGILIIIGSISAIAIGAMFIGGISLLPFGLPGVTEAAGICGIIGAIFLIPGIIAFIGGIFAAQRKRYGFAITGGILAMLFGGFIFGLIGLILVAISKNEFQ